MTFRLFLLIPTIASAGIYPEFRGPTGDGHTTATNVPMEWSEEKNVTWKTPLAGKSWSTPLVSEDKVWLSNATDDGKEMSGFCLDRKTGKILFQEVLFKNDHAEPLGNPVNGYASSTGILYGNRVLFHFGSYGTCALDTTTYQKLWERRDLPCRHYRGPGSSLFNYKETVILSMDGIDFQYLVALDKATGKTIWKKDRSTKWTDVLPDGRIQAEGDMRKAYTTPILINVPGFGDQLISTGSKASFAYEPATGNEIWFSTFPGYSNASRPAFADGKVYINTGYGKATLQAFAVTAETKGDITSTMLWEQKKRIPQRSSPLIVNGMIIVTSDDGQTSALDPATGESIWSDRLPDNFSGSPILVEGKILCCGEQGNSYWVEAGKEFKILAQNKLDAGMLASPVAVDHELYLRTKTHVYRIEHK